MRPIPTLALATPCSRDQSCLTHRPLICASAPAHFLHLLAYRYATALSYMDVGVSMPVLEKLRHLLVGLGVPLVLHLWSPTPHPPLPADLRQGDRYLTMLMVVLVVLMGWTCG